MKRYLLRAAWALILALLLVVFMTTALAEGGYALTVAGGTAEGEGAYAAGTSVALQADEAPAGQVFYRWTCTAGHFDDAYAADAHFTMPASAATVTAAYTGKARVSVSGVSTPDKVYDGQSYAPAGTPGSDAPSAIPAADFVYTYLNADGSQVLSGTPQNAGSYRLVVTVADSNASYFGTSGSMPFRISPAPLEGTAVISGSMTVGQTLTASLADAGGQPVTGTFNYVWLRGDVPISGQSAASYVIADEDAGCILNVSIGGNNYTDNIVSNNTEEVAQAPAPAAPTAPTAASVTETSITLASEAGMEYKCGDGAWQSDAAFSGLTASTTYRFYRRYAATVGRPASEPSPAADIATGGGLSGAITVSGELVYGSVLSASLPGAETGSLSWRWLREGTIVSETNGYTPVAADVDKALTVEVTSAVQSGKVSLVTAQVGRAPYVGAVPGAPTTAAVGGMDVTLTAVDGYEYSQGGTNWQTNPAFTGLTPNTSYSFYQRVRQTDTHLCSAASAALSVTTSDTLGGTIFISGELRFGITLQATFDGPAGAGTLTYTWKRGTMTVGSGQYYNVQAVDIGNQLSVEVTASNMFGSVTRILGTVQKASHVGVTPASPMFSGRTSSSITLKAVSGNEYSMDGVKWTTNNRFSGLSANKSYKFYQRVAATATMEASPASDPVSYTTTSASSGNDDSYDDDRSDTNDTGSVTALYSLTLTGDNTRVLSTTMSNLIKGNETQDVTIKLDVASFTFPKGGMKAVTGQLWYDFGVKINGCIHEQAAAEAAGEGYVATVHYNYDGALPATATIKLWLGAKHAGKTLYYYKFDPNLRSLSFMQTAVTDTTGWVSVTQDSCSDYVFCDRDILLPAQTPTPEPIVTPTPAPTTSIEPVSATPARSNIMSGWLLALVICVALLFIIGGIWLFIKNREE